MPHPSRKVSVDPSLVHIEVFLLPSLDYLPFLRGIDSDTGCVPSEAPRPIGRSESPVVPKNLIGADSPGISDLPDIATHAEGQPSAEGAPCIGD